MKAPLATAEHYEIRNALPGDAPQMEELQKLCFPSLAAAEKLTAAHFLHHINVFPQGQWVVTKDGFVVGSSSTLRVEFPGGDHTFLGITDQLWITNTHLPHGDWLYQFDLGVHPVHRGQQLSTRLYQAQQQLVKDLGMQGQVTVGMTAGYHQYRHELSIEAYCEKLKHQEITDATVTPQRKAGFSWVRPIFNYVDDPSAGNCGILMVLPVDPI